MLHDRLLSGPPAEGERVSDDFWMIASHQGLCSAH